MNHITSCQIFQASPHFLESTRFKFFSSGCPGDLMEIPCCHYVSSSSINIHYFAEDTGGEVGDNIYDSSVAQEAIFSIFTVST